MFLQRFVTVVVPVLTLLGFTFRFSFSRKLLSIINDIKRLEFLLKNFKTQCRGQRLLCKKQKILWLISEIEFVKVLTNEDFFFLNKHEIGISRAGWEGKGCINWLQLKFKAVACRESHQMITISLRSVHMLCNSNSYFGPPTPSNNAFFTNHFVYFRSDWIEKGSWVEWRA